MDKLENYIFYTICEKSYELFETQTNFMTYRMFCYTIKNSIISNDIGGDEYSLIVQIYNHLEMIYGLDYATGIEYIGTYFLDDKCVVFEEPVRLVREYFKNSFN
jgi:hypothetical protein